MAIQIAAFVAVTIAIGFYFREALVKAVPVTVCLLVVELYILSFMDALQFSGIAAVLILAAALVYLWIHEKERRNIGKYLLTELHKPGTIAAIILLAAVPILASGKAVSWWDDLNFWATDVKSIYYRNGFAGKYGNAAPEFGDYPPATQLVKWWFLHMNPGSYEEGLQFSGYYFMNLAFLVPLLDFLPQVQEMQLALLKIKHFKNKESTAKNSIAVRNGKGIAENLQESSKLPAIIANIVLTVLSAAAIWLFPSCVETFAYDGCCADLTMAVVYGAFLSTAVQATTPATEFLQYYGTLSLYSMVLILCKNTGFIWVAFSLIFLLLYQLVQNAGREGTSSQTAQQGEPFQEDRRMPKKEEASAEGRRMPKKEETSAEDGQTLKRNERSSENGRTRKRINWKGVALTALLPALAEGSWLLFCLINRRVAKLTGTAVHMATGSTGIPEVKNELITAYLEAFVSYPLHRNSTFAIDISPLILWIFLIAAVIVLRRLHRISKKEMRLFGGFFLGSGLCFYAINLISHLTIFATETQYLEASGMIASIERYSAPFTIGGLYLLATLTCRTGENCVGEKKLCRNTITNAADAEAFYMDVQKTCEGMQESAQKTEQKPMQELAENHAESAAPETVLETTSKTAHESARKIHGTTHKAAAWLICLAFVFLTADYQTAYNSLFDYGAANEEALAMREEVLDEQALSFADTAEDCWEELYGRVLYIRDASDVSWVRNTYINYEVSPVAVLYENVDTETMSSADVVRMMEEDHASYLYADELIGDSDLLNEMTEGGGFAYGRLYRVVKRGSETKLVSLR